MVVVIPSTVTAVFDTRSSANLAVDALIREDGIDQDSISFLVARLLSKHVRIAFGRSDFSGVVGMASTEVSVGSAVFYAEILRQGGSVVLVCVDGGDAADLASDTLKQHGAIDIDAR